MGIYHSIRSSDEFILMWKEFLVSSPKCESPILFQNITDRMFRKMMAMVFTSIGEQDGDLLLQQHVLYLIKRLTL